MRAYIRPRSLGWSPSGPDGICGLSLNHVIGPLGHKPLADSRRAGLTSYAIIESLQSSVESIHTITVFGQQSTYLVSHLGAVRPAGFGFYAASAYLVAQSTSAERIASPDTSSFTDRSRIPAYPFSGLAHTGFINCRTIGRDSCPNVAITRANNTLLALPPLPQHIYQCFRRNPFSCSRRSRFFKTALPFA